jgi:hypothetical protein
VKLKCFSLVLCFFVISTLCADGATYYQGTGGSGIALTVSRPSGDGLAEGDDWILDFIRYVFTKNFAKFTAVSVQNEEAQALHLRFNNGNLDLDWICV